MAANVFIGTTSMPYLYLSASGNAAAEARANGADEETALLYGLASGGKEFWTEKLFGGIPGLGKGKLDDLVMGLAQTERGRDVLKLAWDFLGEGAEEFISGIAGAYLAKMWNGDERGFWQTLGETLPDAFYEGLVGTLTSALMSLPGSIAEIGDARMSDTALNGIKNGDTLSGVQLAAAETNADGTIDIAALEEDVCLKTFERLIRDPERLTQAVAQDRGVIESFLDVLRGIKNSLVIKLTGSEKAMLDEAERTLTNLLRGEAGIVEGERFSIQRDANGEPYVLIDTDQDLFDGQSLSERIRTAEKYMKKHFQGRPFDVGSSRVFVNGRSVGEYTHPANYRLDREIKQAKINASTELDNLLAVSKFLRHENDDGRHADATNGWEVYQTRFVLNGESFVGEIKIKLTDRGRLFYDITHIEKAARID